MRGMDLWNKRLRDEIIALRKSIDAICDEYKAQNENRNQETPQPVIVQAELKVPEATERDHGYRDDRAHRQQVWLTVGTWLAFIAAAIYAAIAACQLKQMRIASEATRDAATTASQSFIASQMWTEYSMRPYVTLEHVKFISHPQRDQFVSIVGKFINTGTTPATDVTCVDCVLMERIDGKIKKQWPQPKNTIDIGGRGDRTAIFGSDDRLSFVEWSTIDNLGTMELVIQGRIKYRNVYEPDHWYTEKSFCYSWAKGNFEDNFGWCGSPKLKHVKQPKE